jgi:hypothetical protein
VHSRLQALVRPPLAPQRRSDVSALPAPEGTMSPWTNTGRRVQPTWVLLAESTPVSPGHPDDLASPGGDGAELSLSAGTDAARKPTTGVVLFRSLLLFVLGVPLAACGPALASPTMEPPSTPFMPHQVREALKKPSAAQILLRMSLVYSSSRSYRDSGIVTTDLGTSNRGERVTQQTTFSTRFARSARYRFEYCKHLQKFYWGDVIHSDAARTSIWHCPPGELRPMSSLEDAIAQTTGTSDGASHTIAQLLMPDSIGGSGLAGMTAPKRLDDGNVDGRECYRIEGRLGSWDHMIVWIERGSYLVRKIEEFAPSDDSIESTTTYDPAVDIQIPAVEFESTYPPACTCPGGASDEGAPAPQTSDLKG